jgi:putative endopeptidase
MTKYPFDTTVRPQDNYFAYVNNSWLKANPIPPTESSWGTFYELRDASTLAVQEIMDELLSSEPTTLSADQQLLRSFFDTGMRFDSLAANHRESIKKMYATIDAICTPTQLAHHLGVMHRQDQQAFWSVYVDHDDKNSQLQVLRIHQNGLSMPNRDYYLDRSPHMRDIRSAYKLFYAEIREHLGDLVPSDWKAIYKTEQRLAKAAWTNVKLRNIARNYNRYTLDTLQSSFSFDWDAYYAGLGWQNPSDNIVVSQPSFVLAVTELLETTPLEDIKQYLKWRSLLLVIGWTDQQSADIAFRFFGTKISGVTDMKPLWKRVVQSADTLVIGEAIGREYAKKHFPESSKKAVLSIVEDVRNAYRKRLDAVTWMGASTKQIAHRKLSAMKVFIGYPSVWKDLSDLTFYSENHIESILNARRFWSDLELAKVGQPPQEEQWEMNAHTVNAYHHPNRLEIVFPAAILQPPFFDPNASYATNLGGIGAVVGHEFTHGFDDQGADFDEFGNTNRWQKPAERKRFDALAKHIVEQANAYETVPGVHLQGKLILGEAIADIGGLELAIESLRKSTTESSFKKEVITLLVNFARCECGHATKERLIELAKIDPHPPSPFRVNAVVSHISAFYDAYSLQETDALYTPESQRARIW